jgi:hypothetical protein
MDRDDDVEASIPGAASTPVTWRPEVMAAAAPTPVPVPASRIRSFSRSRARCTTTTAMVRSDGAMLWA